jgi:hypothetical protein
MERGSRSSDEEEANPTQHGPLNRTTETPEGFMQQIQSSLKRIWRTTTFQVLWQTVVLLAPGGAFIVAWHNRKKIGLLAENAWRTAGTKLSGLKRKTT